MCQFQVVVELSSRVLELRKEMFEMVKRVRGAKDETIFKIQLGESQQKQL